MYNELWVRLSLSGLKYCVDMTELLPSMMPLVKSRLNQYKMLFALKCYVLYRNHRSDVPEFLLKLELIWQMHVKTGHMRALRYHLIRWDLSKKQYTILYLLPQSTVYRLQSIVRAHNIINFLHTTWRAFLPSGHRVCQTLFKRMSTRNH